MASLPSIICKSLTQNLLNHTKSAEINDGFRKKGAEFHTHKLIACTHRSLSLAEFHPFMLEHFKMCSSFIPIHQVRTLFYTMTMTVWQWIKAYVRIEFFIRILGALWSTTLHHFTCQRECSIFILPSLHSFTSIRLCLHSFPFLFIFVAFRSYYRISLVFHFNW